MPSFKEAADVLVFPEPGRRPHFTLKVLPARWRGDGSTDSSILGLARPAAQVSRTD